jgi:putative NADH-flavin reductase
MKVALIGATGNAGSRILAELAARGHHVTAIARDVSGITPHPQITATRADMADAGTLARILEGHDAVVSSVHFTVTDAPALIETVKSSGVKRYIVVGGAGSLEVAPGTALIDTPGFPDAYRTEAGKGRDFLNLLKEEDGLDWTFLSPSAEFVPGKRTGSFRLGTDQLLTGKEGSRISFEDYALALVDELEHPRHVRQRFTVGY